MTKTEQLIASLNTADNRGLQLDDDRYIDWSSPTADGVVMEVGNGSETVQVDMTRDEVLALQQRLTAYLLTTQ